jgi:hypothetical protein
VLLDAGSDAYDAPYDPGIPVTPEQLQSSARLAAWLCQLFGWSIDRQHLRGHYECPGTTHLDCGQDVSHGGIFPWSDYLAAVIVAADSQVFAANS